MIGLFVAGETEEELFLLEEDGELSSDCSSLTHHSASPDRVPHYSRYLSYHSASPDRYSHYSRNLSLSQP